jgi:hypothetical protein
MTLQSIIPPAPTKIILNTTNTKCKTWISHNKRT